MGRPIKDSNFGNITAGERLVLIADIGAGNEQCWIMQQKGSHKFLVASVAGGATPDRTGVVRLVEGTPAAQGEAQLDATPFGAGGGDGGAELSVASLEAVSVTAVAVGSGYSVGDTLTSAAGDGTRTVATTFDVDTVEVGTVAVNARGSGYALNEVLTNGTGTGTQATFTATGLSTVASQDETNFDGAGSNGTWVGGDGAGGTAYAPSDTITLTDGTVITVDAVDGNDDVTQFTVTSASTSDITSNNPTLTQASSSGSGTGFTLTLGDANQGVRTLTLTTNGSYTVDPTLSGSATTSAGSGTGVTVDLTLTPETLSVNAAGTWTVAPSTAVTATGGAGSGATFTLAFGIKAISVDAGGLDYTASATINAYQSGGSGATFTPVVDGNGTITSVTVDTAGTGFTNASTIQVEIESTSVEAVETIQQYKVKTFQGNVYTWKLGVTGTEVGEAKVQSAG